MTAVNRKAGEDTTATRSRVPKKGVLTMNDMRKMRVAKVKKVEARKAN